MTAKKTPAKDAAKTDTPLAAKETKATVILPTVGRKLYFQPARDQAQATAAGEIIQIDKHTLPVGSAQPLDATIIYVRDEASIDLRVIDHAGKSHHVQRCPLLQQGAAVPQGMFAYWMPYQLGQAAKA